MKYAFNGLLFAQRQTGVMRYAKEILLVIDQICKKNEFVLVLPEYADKAPELQNIKVERYGNIKGNLWEQISFPRYLKIHNLTGVSFNNTCPLCALDGIIVIHDIAYKLHPEFGTSLHGRLSRIYHRLIFSRVSKSKMKIVTVTQFSKYQLIDTYGIDPNRITVIGNAWQHIKQIKGNSNILLRNDLKDKGYYFTLGSMSIMKNTKWVYEVAKRNPDSMFVLAGAKSKGTGNSFEQLNNVIALGFVSDVEVKELLKHCRAFIYPSIYDGFGIPPLEALSQGAEVICSNAACLPEVYGNTVRYIDPYKYDINIEDKMKEAVCDANFALGKYSWRKSGEEFYKLLAENDSSNKE